MILDLPAQLIPGVLCMGSHQPPNSLHDFDVIIGVAKECPILKKDHPYAVVHHVALVDDGPPSEWDVTTAIAAAHTIIKYLHAHQTTLVTCRAGLNRSGWIAGMALVGYTGMSPKEAITLMRQKRSLQVLTNEFFERRLLRDGCPSLPW